MALKKGEGHNQYQMIISHRKKFIYIRLIKVAGTSLEVALSKYCGPDDIITLTSDESTRKSLGYRGAQNYAYNPYLTYPKRVLRIKLFSQLFSYVRPLKKFTGSHSTAAQIKQSIPSEIWRNYFKIATIRCPYDMYISAFYYFHYSENQRSYQRNKPNENFEEFVSHHKSALQLILGLHDENGKFLTDFLIRYEHINKDIESLSEKINAPGLLSTFQALNLKSGLRPKLRTSSCEMYTKYPNAKLILDKKFRKYVDKYEFFQQYWPSYKSALKEALMKHNL